MKEVYKVTIVGRAGLPESLPWTHRGVRMIYPPGEEISGTAILCFRDRDAAVAFLDNNASSGDTWQVWRCEAEGVWIPACILAIYHLTERRAREFWADYSSMTFNEFLAKYADHITRPPCRTRACSKIVLKECVSVYPDIING